MKCKLCGESNNWSYNFDSQGKFDAKEYHIKMRHGGEYWYVHAKYSNAIKEFFDDVEEEEPQKVEYINL